MYSQVKGATTVRSLTGARGRARGGGNTAEAANVPTALIPRFNNSLEQVFFLLQAD